MKSHKGAFWKWINKDDSTKFHLNGSYMQLVTPSEVAMAVKIEIKICISVFQDSLFIVINV